MRKLFWVIMACQMLSACAFYDDPSDQARAERLEAKQATQGCAMRDDNQGVRDCVLATAQKNSPKTYTTGELTTGQPVAVVKNTPVKAQPVYEPLNTVDMAYGSKSGGTAGTGTGAPDNQVTITTMIEATGPVVVAPPSVSVGEKASGQPVSVTPTTASKTESAEYPVVVGKKEPPVVKLTGTAGSSAAVAQQAQPKAQPQAQQQKVAKQAEPLKEKEPNWWDKYVAGKKPTPIQKEGCPCKDPNDPCPQCYEK